MEDDLEFRSCHECRYWLPDEDMCYYPDMPPCIDKYYKGN